MNETDPRPPEVPAEGAAVAGDEVVRIQVGWMNPTTGVMCDCHVSDASPHARYQPVYKEVRRG